MKLHNRTYATLKPPKFISSFFPCFIFLKGTVSSFTFSWLMALFIPLAVTFLILFTHWLSHFSYTFYPLTVTLFLNFLPTDSHTFPVFSVTVILSLYFIPWQSHFPDILPADSHTLPISLCIEHLNFFFFFLQPSSNLLSITLLPQCYKYLCKGSITV